MISQKPSDPMSSNRFGVPSSTDSSGKGAESGIRNVLSAGAASVSAYSRNNTTANRYWLKSA